MPKADSALRQKAFELHAIGLTQKEIAGALKITTRTVTRWLAGANLCGERRGRPEHGRWARIGRLLRKERLALLAQNADFRAGVVVGLSPRRIKHLISEIGIRYNSHYLPKLLAELGWCWRPPADGKAGCWTMVSDRPKRNSGRSSRSRLVIR